MGPSPSALLSYFSPLPHFGEARARVGERSWRSPSNTIKKGARNSPKSFASIAEAQSFPVMTPGLKANAPNETFNPISDLPAPYKDPLPSVPLVAQQAGSIFCDALVILPPPAHDALSGRCLIWFTRNLDYAPWGPVALQGVCLREFHIRDFGQAHSRGENTFIELGFQRTHAVRNIILCPHLQFGPGPSDNIACFQ